MNSRTGHAEAVAPFGSGTLPLAVVVILMRTSMRSSSEPWMVSGVLIADSAGDTLVHPEWPERWAPEIPLSDEWSYLTERVRSGAGGNLMSYELIGFEAIDYETTQRTVSELAMSLAKSERGPFGALVSLGFDLYAADPPANPTEATTKPHLYLVKP